jgi:single-strand DNA-binding protein
MYINKVFLIGNLTRDPEAKALPSGIQVTQFSLATNRVYKDKNGARQEATDYHNVVVFGRQAETCAQYLKRGQTAFIEGRLQTRSWDDKDGKKQYRTEVIADRVQFGPKAGGTGAPGSAAPAGAAAAAPASASAAHSSGPADSGKDIEYPEEEINPEDIPF